MSYQSAAQFQQALYTHLLADADLMTSLDGALYDTVPSGALPSLYAVFGAEDVRDRSDKTSGGSEHRFTVTIVTTEPRFADAKAAAAELSLALVDAAPEMAAGRVVTLRFFRAKARRTRGDSGRRIDLTFRAIVEDT